MAASAPARAHGVALQLRRHRDCDLIAGNAEGGRSAHSVCSPPPPNPGLPGFGLNLMRRSHCGLGVLPSPLWGGAGGGGRCYEATLVRHRTTPTRLASLATLPTRGRVGPSSPLALIPLHLNAILCGRQPATLLL